MHREYGGVVPELASRDHIRRVLPLTRQVLASCHMQLDQVDAIAYTAGPGLAGALLVGASVAQSIAWSLKKPTIAIHHLEGHLLSPLLAEPRPDFPFVALLVSGGHTQLMRVDGVGQYELLGEKLMGLGYPGGPALSRLAEQGDPSVYELPRPMMHSKDLDFSFSGLKTAVLTRLRKLEAEEGGITEQQRADLAAATEAAIVDVLAAKAIKALKQTGLKRLVVAGGVGANRHLRAYLQKAVARLKGEVFFPPLEFCTDNGAMIAFAAAMRVKHGLVTLDDSQHGFAIRPRWDLACVNQPVSQQER
jgi:N6-L-threonylcarbamoyladenine synthase